MRYRFHFDMGNTNSGQIGMCASIEADSKEQAVERLRRIINDEAPEERVSLFESERQYVQIYINPRNIKIEDIDALTPVCPHCHEEID